MVPPASPLAFKVPAMVNLPLSADNWICWAVNVVSWLKAWSPLRLRTLMDFEKLASDADWPCAMRSAKAFRSTACWLSMLKRPPVCPWLEVASKVPSSFTTPLAALKAMLPAVPAPDPADTFSTPPWSRRMSLFWDVAVKAPPMLSMATPSMRWVMPDKSVRDWPLK